MTDGQRGPPGRGLGRRGVPPEACICPSCGEEVQKARGVPCREMKCPKCGAVMVGKWKGAC